MFICLPDHPLARRTQVTIASLAEHDFVGPPQGSTGYEAVNRALAGTGKERRVTFEAVNVLTILDFVAHGLGFTLLPEYLATSRPDLRAIPLAGPDMTWTLAAIMSRHQATPAGRAFAALLRSRDRPSNPAQTRGYRRWCWPTGTSTALSCGTPPARPARSLLWRTRRGHVLRPHERLPDGSWLARLRRFSNYHMRGTDVVVRVIDYAVADPGRPQAEDRYRLLTTITDPHAAPAAELAALYPQRWEFETALDQLKTHQRGPRVVLRSKMPDGVRQEIYGYLCVHYAIRWLMPSPGLAPSRPKTTTAATNAEHPTPRTCQATRPDPPGRS